MSGNNNNGMRLYVVSTRAKPEPMNITMIHDLISCGVFDGERKPGYVAGSSLGIMALGSSERAQTEETMCRYVPNTDISELFVEHMVDSFEVFKGESDTADVFPHSPPLSGLQMSHLLGAGTDEMPVNFLLSHLKETSQPIVPDPTPIVEELKNLKDQDRRPEMPVQQSWHPSMVFAYRVVEMLTDWARFFLAHQEHVGVLWIGLDMVGLKIGLDPDHVLRHKLAIFCGIIEKAIMQDPDLACLIGTVVVEVPEAAMSQISRADVISPYIKEVPVPNQGGYVDNMAGQFNIRTICSDNLVELRQALLSDRPQISLKKVRFRKNKKSLEARFSVDSEVLEGRYFEAVLKMVARVIMGSADDTERRVYSRETQIALMYGLSYRSQPPTHHSVVSRLDYPFFKGFEYMTPTMPSRHIKKSDVGVTNLTGGLAAVCDVRGISEKPANGFYRILWHAIALFTYFSTGTQYVSTRSRCIDMLNRLFQACKGKGVLSQASFEALDQEIGKLRKLYLNSTMVRHDTCYLALLIVRKYIQDVIPLISLDTFFHGRVDLLCKNFHYPPESDKLVEGSDLDIMREHFGATGADWGDIQSFQGLLPFFKRSLNESDLEFMLNASA